MAYTQEEILKLVEEEYIQVDYVPTNFCDCDDCTSTKLVKRSRVGRVPWHGVESESDEEESSRGGAINKDWSVNNILI